MGLEVSVVVVIVGSVLLAIMNSSGVMWTLDEWVYLYTHTHRFWHLLHVYNAYPSSTI